MFNILIAQVRHRRDKLINITHTAHALLEPARSPTGQCVTDVTINHDAPNRFSTTAAEVALFFADKCLPQSVHRQAIKYL